MFLSINLCAAVLGYWSYNKYSQAQESVYLVQRNIEENRKRLESGNTELNRAKRRWEGALVMIERMEGYKKISSSMLQNSARSFNNLVTNLAAQNRLFVVSYDALSPASTKFGNFTYDGRMFDVVIRGSYRNMGAFITAMENKVPLLEIENMRIVNDPNNPGQLLLNMRVFIIRDIQESRAKVEAKK